MKKVFVTGATGFIGFEVSRRLAESGLRPRLLVRRPMRGTLLASLDADIIQGSLEDRRSLREGVRGCDAVIHLGARATFERFDVVRPSIVQGSKNLMEEALEAGVRTFVHASSLLVYSSQKGLIDEKTPPVTRIHYGQAKLESEAVLSEMAQGTPLQLGIVRLPHVYGACDLIFNLIRKGRVINPGSGKNVYAHMHVADAARLLMAMAEQGWTGVSPTADNMPASWNTFFAEVKRHYPRFRLLHLPDWFAFCGTYCLTELRRLRGLPSLETPDAIRAWNLNVPVRAGLIWKDLGIDPLYPTIREGIPAVIDSAVAFRWCTSIEDRCPHPAQCASDPVEEKLPRNVP